MYLVVNRFGKERIRQTSINFIVWSFSRNRYFISSIVSNINDRRTIFVWVNKFLLSKIGHCFHENHVSPQSTLIIADTLGDVV